jgi:hypothetical protein
MPSSKTDVGAYGFYRPARATELGREATFAPVPPLALVRAITCLDGRTVFSLGGGLSNVPEWFRAAGLFAVFAGALHPQERLNVDHVPWVQISKVTL